MEDNELRDYWSEKEKQNLLNEAVNSKAFIYIPSLEKNILELLEKNKGIPESFEKDLREILSRSKKMVIMTMAHDGYEMVRFFSLRQFVKGSNEIFDGGVVVKMKITEFF